MFGSAAEWERNLLISEKLYPSVTEHVGDWYRFETRNVQGLESITKLLDLARQMRAEGFTPATIEGTLGENFRTSLARRVGDRPRDLDDAAQGRRKDPGVRSEPIRRPEAISIACPSTGTPPKGSDSRPCGTHGITR